MASPLILSLGSINADFAFEVGDDFGGGGTLRAKSFSQRAGGKGANVAILAHRLGVEVKLIGRVGDDHFADQALGPLRAAGLDLSCVSAAQGSTTGVAMIGVPESGAKAILLAANANMDWDESALHRLVQVIAEAPDGSVLVADFEISRDALEAAFDAAEARGFPIVVDPSFAQEVRRSDLARIHAIAPNDQEAGTLADLTAESDQDAAKAARELIEAGVAMACVKLSHGGCILAQADEVTGIPAPEGEVIDKTGAGDAFTAALAVAIMEGREAVEAAAWGVAASTLAVSAKGSQEAYPSRQEVEELAEQIVQTVNADL